MDSISDNQLFLIIQNLELALDYQHQKVKDGKIPAEEVEDTEEYLVQVEQALTAVKDEYKRRARSNPDLPGLSEIPVLDL